MPELPEVETIRRDLQRVVVGRVIESVDVLVAKLFKGDKNILQGETLQEVERLGKMLVMHFSQNVDLVIHLKMTGQLIWLPPNQNDELRIKNYEKEKGIVGGHPDKAYSTLPPHKYTHIIITFTDGATLYYNDLRKFGWMKIIKNSNLKSQNYNSKFKIGVDALSKKLTEDYLEKICKNRKIAIKQLLMDQGLIAGIGNIYGDEILFCAKVLPTNKAFDLSGDQIKNIVKCIPIILNKSIKAGGTSSSDYRKIDGSKGGYLDVAWVYGREGLPCRVCRKPIKRIKIGQRSSHYCSKCQNTDSLTADKFVL